MVDAAQCSVAPRLGDITSSPWESSVAAIVSCGKDVAEVLSIIPAPVRCGRRLMSTSASSWGEVGWSKGSGWRRHARSESKRRDRTQTPTNDPTNDSVQKCDGRRATDRSGKIYIGCQVALFVETFALSWGLRGFWQVECVVECVRVGSFGLRAVRVTLSSPVSVVASESLSFLIGTSLWGFSNSRSCAVTASRRSGTHKVTSNVDCSKYQYSIKKMLTA